ncbi:disease resistance protein PIK6-NP-like [Telopea speciosissima]|uniref:disease resistance protein PIK6-NP-like n=1 Tax=Telopea speciosissima TaxID=54955 RepID=UPI001CC3CF3F|nr:disease resistance protein PIK6-NP-like [Telopea speciosissima]
MAEGTIISFAKKLAVITVEEYNFLQGVEGQVVSLRDELEWISSFLRDAAVQRSKYERVDVWVSQVRDLAYDAEDVLDIFIHKVKRLKERSWLRFLSKWPLIFPGPPITLHKLGNQISNINTRIEKISAYKSRYAIDKLKDKDSLGKDVALNKRKALALDEEIIIGFDSQSKEVEKILTQQRDDSSQLHIVSIVGMAGTGKSTLAYKVYKVVTNQFDSCAWINVSQEFEPQRLLQSMTEQNPEKTNFGRLLVVFDDVWREKDWDSIYQDILEKINIDRKESRVLITSRFDYVAKHAKSRINQIGKLDDKDCLELLKRKVFHDEKDFPKELEKLAEQIVKKCNSLPLAIVVLGGLLSTKQRTIDVWTKVVRSARWQLLQGSTECFEVLDLSYDNLPNQLKPCFLYFGLFPEDCPINCETIIQLWIAEGFIQERGEESMEDVAEDCLEDLIQRNMIQVDCRRSNGTLETCRIHDLLREFAISKGRHDKFLDILGDKRLANRCIMSRRLAIYSNNEEAEGTEIPDSTSLNNPRSILCFTNLSKKKLENTSFYKNFTLLRVLDLQGATELQSLPDAIGKLVLLKYLNLRGARVKRLPSSIRKLQNLQTLDISETQIFGIPCSVWKLEELRHFYANLELISTKAGSCCDLHCGGSPQIGRLRNLLTLSTREYNWISKDFNGLIDLRKLKITGVDMDRYGEILSKSILKFVYLRELEIEWARGKLQFQDSLSQHVHLYKMRLSGAMEKLPDDCNVFPPNLIELELSNTKLEQNGDSMKTLAKLENLQFLQLRKSSFLGNHMVFPKDGFPKLLSLDIGLLSDLEEWTVENGSLANLKVLNLKSLDNLKKLPDGFDIAKLQKLKLLLMPQQLSESVGRDKKVDNLERPQASTEEPEGGKCKNNLLMDLLINVPHLCNSAYKHGVQHLILPGVTFNFEAEFRTQLLGLDQAREL